jgi:hypothetical protein
VPKDFRGKPEDATAAIMLGDELGLSPHVALRSVYVIHGTPSIYARTMVALAQPSHGHDVWTEESSESRGHRLRAAARARSTSSVVWTIDRARKAGYTNNKKYESDPQAMLYAKAAGEVCQEDRPRRAGRRPARRRGPGARGAQVWGSLRDDWRDPIGVLTEAFADARMEGRREVMDRLGPIIADAEVARSEMADEVYQ